MALVKGLAPRLLVVIGAAGQRETDESADGTGANPVGGIIRVAPTGGARSEPDIICPDGRINVIVAVGGVYIQAGTNPSGAIRLGSGECALSVVSRIGGLQVSERAQRRLRSQCMTGAEIARRIGAKRRAEAGAGHALGMGQVS